MAKYKNRASGNAQVGMMIGHVEGVVQNVGGASRQAGGELDSDLLLSKIAELRGDIVALQQRNVLALAAASAAQRELDTAEGTIEAAAYGDTAGLLASLKRLRKPLAGAVDLLAKIADIAAVVKGLR